MLVEHHFVNAERALDLRMDGELVIVDHRKDGVEVHERAVLRNVEGEDLLKVRILQQVARERLRAGDRRALGKTDGHNVLRQHEHVAALDGVTVGQVVPHLVVQRGKVSVVEVHVL